MARAVHQLVRIKAKRGAQIRQEMLVKTWAQIVWQTTEWRPWENKAERFRARNTALLQFATTGHKSILPHQSILWEHPATTKSEKNNR